MLKDVKSDGRGFNVVFGIKNLAICLVLTVAMLFFASIAAVFASWQGAVVSLVVSIITYLCVGVCGFRFAKNTGSHGLFAGAIAGLSYTLMLYILRCIAFADFSFNTSAMLTALICVMCGAVGGVIGVNAKVKRKR